MIDRDISTLADRPPDRPLDGLEADIWTGVAAHAAARKTGRLIASCQAGVMAIALVGGAVAGTMTAVSAKPDRVVIGSSAELAPSNLLLGAHR